MRSLLFVVIVLSSTASAQVIECPKRLPSEEMPLSDVSSAYKGSARLRPTGLSYAYMYVGELYGGLDLVLPEVKASTDIKHGFRPHDSKWLVCVYGGEWGGGNSPDYGNVEWWGKLDPKITSCILKIRKTKNQGSAIEWTAAATCK